MADPRFFTCKGPFRLEELASISGAALLRQEDGARQVTGVAPLDKAGASEISFLDNNKYAEAFQHSRAGFCVVREAYAQKAPHGMALLVTGDPYRAFALIAQAFFPEPEIEPGIAPTAVVAADAVLGKGVRIDAGAVVGAKAEIGADTHIGPNAVIGHGVMLGEGCRIGAGVTLHYTLAGKNVIILPGAHIGQDGFGFAPGAEGHVKVPQLGRVIIEDDVEIGAGTCIDRGSGPDTVIGRGAKIDNLVQIGHNVHIGRGSIVVSQVGISGSTRVGDFVILGGQAGVAGHVTIGAGTRFAARSGITRDIVQPGTYGGFPAVPVQEWRRQQATLSRLAKRKKETDDE